MKRIALIAAALPVSAQAHGVHLVEAGPAGHTISHTAPILGLTVVVVAALIALRRARG